ASAVATLPHRLPQLIAPRAGAVEGLPRGLLSSRRPWGAGETCADRIGLDAGRPATSGKDSPTVARLQRPYRPAGLRSRLTGSPAAGSIRSRDFGSNCAA